MKNSRFAPAACILMTLTGCGLAQKQMLDNANKQVAAIVAECKAKKATGEFKRWEEISDCTDGPVRDIYLAANYPYMDLSNLLSAKARVTYQRIDQKKLTPAEGELEIAQATTDVNNLLYQREGVIAQRRGAAAAQSAAGAQWMNAVNANRPRTCTGYGASVTCY